MKIIALCVFCLDILVGSIIILTDLPSKESASGSHASHNAISAKHRAPLPATTLP